MGFTAKWMSNGQMAYQGYLSSDHWAEMKRLKAEDTPAICAVCKYDDQIQLHHMIYRARLQDALLSDLCWLCRGCHKTFHLRAGMQFPKTVFTGDLLQRTVDVITGKTVIAKKMSIKRLNEIRLHLDEAIHPGKSRRRSKEVFISPLSSYSGVVVFRSAA